MTDRPTERQTDWSLLFSKLTHTLLSPSHTHSFAHTHTLSHSNPLPLSHTLSLLSVNLSFYLNSDTGFAVKLHCDFMFILGNLNSSDNDKIDNNPGHIGKILCCYLSGATQKAATSSHVTTSSCCLLKVRSSCHASAASSCLHDLLVCKKTCNVMLQ